MAFFNSGIRRILEGKINRSTSQNARAIRILESNEKADDTSRSGISGIVAGHTTQIDELNTFRNHSDQTIITEEFTEAYNDFMYRRSINLHNFENTIPVTKMVDIISLSAWIYNPDGIGKTPTYNASSLGNLIMLTRNSAIIAASSTNVGNAQRGGGEIMVAQTGGATWLDGLTGAPALGPHVYTNQNDGDARRCTDHLNQLAGGVTTGMDPKLTIIAVPATNNPDVSAAGNATKIKLIVKYRLYDFPTLS